MTKNMNASRPSKFQKNLYVAKPPEQSHTLSVLVANPKKTTLHNGQSRAWSVEEGKEKKRESLAAPAPPTPQCCSFGENKIKIT